VEVWHSDDWGVWMLGLKKAEVKEIVKDGLR
jgi:hypothetical protein